MNQFVDKQIPSPLLLKASEFDDSPDLVVLRSKVDYLKSVVKLTMINFNKTVSERTKKESNFIFETGKPFSMKK